MLFIVHNQSFYLSDYYTTFGIIKAAIKFLQGLPQKLRDSIREAIKGLTQVVEESVRMLEMLPESEQELASQLIKRLVLAGDPDFTTLTPEERVRLEAA